MTPDPVRVINLDRTPERLASFRRDNPHLAIERVAAVDGAAVDRAACIRDGILRPENQYRPGAVGLALTEIALWRACAAGGVAFHVAEDDMTLRADFHAASARALAALPAWDIVLWTWNFDWPLRVALGAGLPAAVLQCEVADLRDHAASFAAATQPPLLLKLASAAGTGCYSVSPEGARRLLALCLPIGAAPAEYAARPERAWVNLGIDVEMSRHYAAMRAFVAVPPLAVSPNDQDASTVRGHLAAMHDPAIANRAPR